MIPDELLDYHALAGTAGAVDQYVLHAHSCWKIQEIVQTGQNAFRSRVADPAIDPQRSGSIAGQSVILIPGRGASAGPRGS